MLFLRGLDRNQADDVVQEVAVRALAVGLRFDSAEHFYAWAAPVARNLHVDLMRSRARTTDGAAALPAIPASTNVEHEVERRIALERVLKALAMMGDADRSAILDKITDDGCGDGPEAGKLAVRRHRARQRLRLLVKGALGWTSLVHALRRPRVPFVLPTMTSAALAAPLLLVTLLPTTPSEGFTARVDRPVTVANVPRHDLALASSASTVPVRDARPAPAATKAPAAPAPPGKPDDTTVEVGVPVDDGIGAKGTVKSGEDEQWAVCVNHLFNRGRSCYIKRIRVTGDDRKPLPVTTGDVAVPGVPVPPPAK